MPGVLPRIKAARVERLLTESLRRYVFEEAGARGGVVGVSGGVDSAVAAVLAARALGPENTYLMILPSAATPKEDVEDALLVAEHAGVPRSNVEVLDIEPLLQAFDKALGEMTLVERGNVAARVRMIVLHQRAYRRRYLVVGSGDRSELLIGYFTKYGDGGVDVLPLGGLYKTWVRQLALHLGLPERIALKPSSPRLWPGQTAEAELGISYEVIDPVLYAVFDLGLGAEEAARRVGVSVSVVERILQMHKRSEHKRRPPPVLSLPLGEILEG
ncbi:MAG: NAD+ synthase [Thermofilum sp.]|jgi:NAD+ synthase|nr:NAD+ synthase [Thermofilum sp.]